MADVQLNLIYNDNGAQNNVDKLVNVLRQIESRRYNINLSLPNMDRTNAQLHDMVDQLENIRKMSSGRPGEMFQGLSLSGLESAIQKAEASVNRYKQIIADFYGQLRNAKDVKEYDSILNQIENSNEGLINSTKQLASLRTIFDSLSETSGFKSLNQQIEETIKNIENLQKYGTTNVTHDEAVGRRVSAMLGLSALPSSATTEVPQSPRGQYARYLDYSGISESLKTQEEEVKEVTEEVKKDNRNVFADLQQVATSVFQLLKRGWSDFKGFVEAPLNLTGVNQLVSLVDKLEGSLVLDKITSNITSGFSRSLERYDILQTYPKIIQSLGYTSDEATESMDRLYKSVLGLPTAFGDIVNSAQYFTLVLDDLDKATDLAIAANNAFVASGASSQQVTYGMRQLQYIMDGTQLRSTQWYSLIRSMPVALKEVGIALGYPDYSSFTADLIKNKIANEEFIDALIDVGLHSEKLGNVLESMKDRATAALTNVENAAMRMGENWLSTLDAVLERTGGKGLEDNIKGVSSIIDHIAEVGADWIETHGDEIQGLIDKAMSIDWAELIPNLFQGLVDIADKALDNIDEWIPKIGNIISDVKTLFNEVDNSRTIRVLEMLGGGLGGGLALGGALKYLFGSAGLLGGGATAGAGLASGAGIGSALSVLAIPAAAVGGSILIGKKESDESYRKGMEYIQSAEGKSQLVALMSELRREALAAGYGTHVSGSYQEISPRDGASSELFYGVEYSEEAAKAAVERTNHVIELIREATHGIINLQTVSYDSYGEYLDVISEILEFVNKYLSENSDLTKTLKNRAMDDILANEIPQAHESALNLYEEIAKLQEEYDRVTEKYTQRLSVIDERRARISALIEKLQKEGFEWQYKTSADYAGIYGGKDGKGGKFFSEQVKESFGGLFRNTLEDFGKIQAELTPQISELNQKMIDTISGYEGTEAEKSQLLEAWASILGGIDPNDPGSVSRLQTMITEGPSKLIETYLIPTIKSNEALNENRKLLQEAMLEALGLAGGEADTEEDEIFEEMAKDNRIVAIGKALQAALKDMNENYLPLIEDGLINFSNEVVKYIKEAMERIDELEVVARPTINVLPQLLLRSPSGETAPADASSVSRSTRQLERLVRQTQPFATGGFAPMGTDTIPAMLTPGEYVQRRAAVQYFGKSFMDRINALDLRGALRSIYTSFATPYATGGFVRSDNRSYRDNHATVNQVFNSSNSSTGLRRVSRFVRALS